jgi:hypothetical protein
MIGELRRHISHGLLSDLRGQLRHREAEFLVVHAGVAFSFCPLAMLAMLSSLKTDFPGIHLVIEGNAVAHEALAARPEYQAILDTSSVAQKITELVFASLAGG